MPGSATQESPSLQTLQTHLQPTGGRRSPRQHPTNTELRHAQRRGLTLTEPPPSPRITPSRPRYPYPASRDGALVLCCLRPMRCRNYGAAAMSDAHEDQNASGSWQPDPTSRYKLRWRDAAGNWTDHVYSSDGQMGNDPYDTPSPPPPSPLPPESQSETLQAPGAQPHGETLTRAEARKARTEAKKAELRQRLADQKTLKADQQAFKKAQREAVKSAAGMGGKLLALARLHFDDDETDLCSVRGTYETKRALRESGWSEGVEEGPVGFAGIQQGPDPVVVEVGEPEGGAFDAFGQVVGAYLEGWTLWWFGAWVSCGRHVADGAGMRLWRRWPRCWARCSRSWWLSALSLVISSRAASRRCRSDSADPRSGDGTGTAWAVATRRSRSMSARRSGWR